MTVNILLTCVNCIYFINCSGKRNGVCKRLREEPGLDGMLDMGGCCLHTINNAYRKATQSVFPEIPELADDVFSFFERSEKRRHEFRKVVLIIFYNFSSINTNTLYLLLLNSYLFFSKF